MEPLQLTQEDFERYVNRAKERYVTKHWKRGSKTIFLFLFFIAGIIEGSFLVERFRVKELLSLVVLIGLGIVQGLFYWLYLYRSYSIEIRRANKPANIIFMLREILEEDARIHLPYIEGLCVLLNQFRRGELIRANHPEDLETIDRALEIVKRFCDANRVEVEEVQNQRLQFIQSQLESTS